jgi:hypothetical protein
VQKIRDGNGRFVEGNPGGPGNPFARRVAALRKVLLSAITHEDIEAMTRLLLDRAKGGDVAAIKLLLAYVVGKPVEAVDPDQLDADEWKFYRQRWTTAEELGQILAGLPPGMACAIVRTVVPALEAEAGRKLLEELER